MSLNCIVWCCRVLYCCLRRAGCISQDTYLLYYIWFSSTLTIKLLKLFFEVNQCLYSLSSRWTAALTFSYTSFWAGGSRQQVRGDFFILSKQKLIEVLHRKHFFFFQYISDFVISGADLVWNEIRFIEVLTQVQCEVPKVELLVSGPKHNWAATARCIFDGNEKHFGESIFWSALSSANIATISLNCNLS